MSDREQPGSWIGASLLRKEDARYLHGRGMFIADVDIPGVQDVAFVRSQMANANIRQVIKPPESAGRIFTLAEIGPINILEAGPELAAHRHSPYPPLADRRVRYVGQTIAACMPNPDADTVRQQLSGHICRCTGYAGIVNAIVTAGKAINGDTKRSP